MMTQVIQTPAQTVLAMMPNTLVSGFFCCDGQMRSADALQHFDATLAHAALWPADLAPKTGSHTVYNFEVAETHTYIAGGYRVHNTSTLSFYDPAEHGQLTAIYEDAQGRLVWESVTPDGGHWVTVSNSVPGTNTTSVTTTYSLGAFNPDGTPVIDPATGEPVSQFYIQTANLYETVDGEDVLRDVVINENYWLYGDEYGGQVAGAVTPYILQAIGADSVFEQLAVGTLTQTLMQNLLEGGFNAIHASLLDMPTNGEVFEEMIFGAWDDFGIDLAVNGIDTAVSLVHQLIMAEIYSAFDINSVPEEFMAAIVANGIENVLASGVDLLIDNILGADSAIATAYDPQLFDFGSVQSYTGLLLGIVLDRLLPDHETVEGQIASSIAQIFAGGLGLGFLPGMIVAQLIGFIVGAIFDAIFDKDPQAFSTVGYNDATGKWSITGMMSDDGGNVEMASQLGRNVMDKLNEFADLMQSTDLDFGMESLQIGHYEKHLRNGDGTNYALGDSEVILAAVVNALKTATASDGDLKVLRALNLPGLVADLAGKTPTEAFSILYSQARLAADYQYYLDNAFYINNLMMNAPNSAEARAWMLTLLQARAAGLDDGYETAGTAADNLILTADGADSISGGAGNDTIKSYAGADSVAGGADSDEIHGGSGNDTLSGGDGADHLYGGDNDDSIDGNAGNDVVQGNAGADQIDAGAGDDRIEGGAGPDTIIGGDGTDWLDHFDAASGVHVDLTQGAGFAGDAAGDVISGVENIHGGIHDDTLLGDAGQNQINGSDGDDQIWGMEGDDDIYGGGGDDALYGDRGESLGGGGADWIYGGDGNDTLYGGLGVDTFTGGLGIDVVNFVYAPNSVVGTIDGGEALNGAEIETLAEVEGLTGSVFADELTGNDSANTLQGGTGNDTLNGARGNDTYTYAYGDGSDYIVDYDGSTNTDVLQITGVAVGDVQFWQDDHENLIIRFANGQQITVQQQFFGALVYYNIEQITFDGGIVLDAAAIRQKMVADMKATGTVIGSNFAETYSHTTGDGSYWITDWSSLDNDIDRLTFTDLTADQVQFSQDSDENLIMLLDSGETITITDMFLGSLTYYAMEEITFADGTVLDFAGIRARVVADMKAGGLVLGTDHAEDYHHAMGDGSYHIVDWDGGGRVDRLILDDADLSDVRFSQSDGDDLLIWFANGDVVRVDDQFVLDTPYWGIEQLVLADGTVMDFAAIRAKMVSDMKAEGSVVGSRLADVYTHSIGDGSYTIYDYDSALRTDSLTFTDLDSTDVAFVQVGSDLRIITNTGETIILRQQFASSGYTALETLTFADGITYLAADLAALLVPMATLTGQIVGTTADETYTHMAGNGAITITDYNYFGGADVLHFTDQTASDLTFSRAGNDLVLTRANGETVTIYRFLEDGNRYAIETMTFSDGTSMTQSQIRNRLMADMRDAGAVVGTENDETYHHTNGDGSYAITDYDYFSGNDQLILTDTTAAVVRLSRSGDDMRLHLAGGEVITLIKQLDGSLRYGVEQVVFAGGTVMTEVELRDRLMADMRATGRVVGTDNNETYHHANGNGSYSIADYDYFTGTDRLILADTTLAGLRLSRSGNDMRLHLAGGEVITLIKQLDGSLRYGLEQVIFAGGTVLTEEDLRNRLMHDMKATGRVVGTENDEVYRHTKGDGSYTIKDYDYFNGADRLTLTDSTASTIRFSRVGNDLQITLDNGEVITLERQLEESQRYAIETLMFSDGSTLTSAQMRDRLVADMKQDGLAIGTENNETYHHASGDGSWMIRDYDYFEGADRLVFDDVLASQVTLSRHGNALIITLANGEAVTILGQLNEDLRRTVEQFEFADGTVLTEAQMRNRMVSDMKSTGSVVGTENDETYSHTAGNGSYSITDYDYFKGADRLIFTNVNADQIVLSRVGYDMTITLPNGEVITLVKHLAINQRNSIEQFEFADGTVLTEAHMRNKLIADMKAAGWVVGAAEAEIFTYVAGEGSYAIFDSYADSDRLVMAGVKVSEVDFRRVGIDLEIRVLANGETITLASYFEGNAFKIAEVTFADGTVLGQTRLNTITATRTMIGTTGADTLLGLAAADILMGEAGADSLDGGAGHDVLNGGSGVDTLRGGAGNDSYTVDNATDQVIEDSDAGFDDVTASLSWTLAAHVDALTLAGTTALNGTGNALGNRMTGNSGVNLLLGLDGVDTLFGGAGNDTLDGGTGADEMAGEAGDDRYLVDDTTDQIIEAAAAGTDTVVATASYVLAANLETLILGGVGVIDGTGNDLANRIEGNTAGNRLAGAGGNDTLIGGDGNDTLTGDVGNDSMVGGAGNDVYLVDATTDAVVEGATGGTDRVETTVSLTLGTEVENLVLAGGGLLNGTGNGLANQIDGNGVANALSGLAGMDTLIGGAGNDSLDGGTGQDSLVGGAGDDLYTVDQVDDILSELVDGGLDHVQSTVTLSLANYLENLTLLGTLVINGTGNGLNNRITGNSAANTLSGLGGVDTLLGNSGNDTLDGGLGADQMEGGSGNDTYLVNGVADVVIEAAYGGTDTVLTTAALTLAAQVENLTLTGTSALNGTGNTLANIMTGNIANNTLNGDAGNDTLYGDAGNDKLDGGTGNDRMEGGVGADTYYVNSTSDLVIEAVAGGTDTVQTSVTLTLMAEVERMVLTGTTGVNGTGNALANILTGNSGANRLTGMDGSDQLIGVAGNDTLVGGLGADRFVFNSTSSGVDTVSDFNQLDGGLAESDRLEFRGLLTGTFAYLGAAAFTGGSDNSEARVSGANVLVDTNGDGTTDITVTLTGLTLASQLTAANFLFS